MIIPKVSTFSMRSSNPGNGYSVVLENGTVIGKSPFEGFLTLKYCLQCSKVYEIKSFKLYVYNGWLYSMWVNIVSVMHIISDK